MIMADTLGRDNFDGYWFLVAEQSGSYTKFQHRPVRERDGARWRVRSPLAEAVLDHHVAPAAVAGALARRGFTRAARLLTERLPRDERTRAGNFGEVVAS